MEQAKQEAEMNYTHSQLEDQKRHRKDADELILDLKTEISNLKENLNKERSEHTKEVEKSISLISQKESVIVRLKEEIRR